MSTQAQAKQNRAFRKAPAPKLPTLVCTGYVSVVGEGKESEKGVYNVNPVEINGYGGSRNTKVQILTRPEWFSLDASGNPDFRPDQITDNGMAFVYRKNIAAVDGISNLRGLAGNEERYAALSNLLFAAEGIAGDTSFNAIQNVLESFLIPAEGEDSVEIGYVLKQKRTKTEDLDENGKNIYLLENKYEVSDFFEATDENKKKYRKSAEKSAEKADKARTPYTFKVCFDEGAPF